MSHDRRFQKHERLRLRKDFARVFARKCTAADEILAVHVAENGLRWSRLGISVAKRMGNAVRRNYVRRRIREAFRISKADLPQGFDIVCVARSKAKDPRCDVARSLHALVAKAVRQAGENVKTSTSRFRRCDFLIL